MTKIYLLSFILFLFSCKSIKNENKKSAEIIKKELNMKGYLTGEIVFNEKCNFLIKKISDNTLLDPINFDDKKFVFDKKEGTKIYFKSLSLRRQSRCNNTLPIELTEVIEVK